MSHVIVSLTKANSSAYSDSFHTPSLAISVTTSTTNWNRKRESTDPWWIHTLASNPSDNSESNMTVVFLPHADWEMA